MQRRTTLAKKICYQHINWFNQYKQLSNNEDFHVLLESGRGGKYSIMGLKPFAILKGKNHELVITMVDENRQEIVKGDPLDSMKKWMMNYETNQNPSYPDFQGGAIGFISYDYARYIEGLPEQSADDLDTPDLYFMVFNDLVLFDHEEEVLWLITHYEDSIDEGELRLEQLEHQWTSPLNDFKELSFHYQGDTNNLISFQEQDFHDAVCKIKDYIANGDIFQVNLSVRQSQTLESHPMKIYENLRKINPSPYMSYVHFPEFQLVSGSPELLVKKKGLEVSTRPIAGTRSRGMNEEEDSQLANELIENEKERAEHVMLVDLERNDLGRVCRFGTVEVNEFMVIEKYSHVMHIVSNVRGELASDKDAYDVLRAAFPGGTITGAPKVRTMEIIEELEPVRRGVYTGSIGWISFSGEMEMNIAIRTLVAKDGIAHVQAGAGIVIDSNPKHEYKESLKKAKALWKAKELSEAE
ncbi:aminodeoxychorismate synthase, component I [Litchfieldia salsa]|uniref:Aminodeoxychorismate synthase component 1 n=1 Tax=Litchfieldia salsa TaxID=930152 RepID=A0A1H0WZ50_9BACI|nr:aminodeoxychorismate synthase, component I [Litchfieldia salsa]SDP95932.1 aminodeoxychorismate synthase, subunit I [Litchfieldia salsa]